MLCSTIYTVKRPEKFSIVFFDLECTQDKQIGENSYLHEPNLCIAQRICELCYIHDSDFYECKNCISRQSIFENDSYSNCVKFFLDFIETYKSRDVYCIAHNFKGYDSQFIINELFFRSDSVKLIMAGRKIMRIVYKSYITFIDSLNFLPMPLCKFPDTFGLKNISKGYYPHFFNTSSNLNYIGSIPGQDMFGVDSFTTGETKNFLNWYLPLKNDKNYVFNNIVELKKYCALDVSILRKGCIQFMIDFINILDINPFLQSMTLAQAVMLGFRKKFLIPNTLGIVPRTNYMFGKTQSAIGTF